MRISDWSSDVCSSDLTLLSGYFARPGAPEQGKIHLMCSVLVDGGKREGLQPRDPSADRDGRGAALDPIAQDHGSLVGRAAYDGGRGGGRPEGRRVGTARDSTGRLRWSSATVKQHI